MTGNATEKELSLQIERTFAARRERVFAAWTERDQITRWLCRTSPDSQPEINLLEFDLRPGGSLRMNITNADGKVFKLRCEFREIRKPERLVFTWTWEQEAGFGETLVTVEFHEEGDSTKVVLTHGGFPSEEWKNNHNFGWNGCFDTLAGIL